MLKNKYIKIGSIILCVGLITCFATIYNLLMQKDETVKRFEYYEEIEEVDINFMGTAKKVYSQMNFLEGQYINTFVQDTSKQYGNILELKNSYIGQGIHSFNELYQMKSDGSYIRIGSSLGEGLQLKSFQNCDYYEYYKLQYQNEIILCGEVFTCKSGLYTSLGNMIIRKNINTEKEEHYYLDDIYKIYIPENEPLKTIYLYRYLDMEDNYYNRLEIWEYNLDNNVMERVETIKEKFSSAAIAVSDNMEMFFLFYLEKGKNNVSVTKGIYSKNNKTFQTDLDIISDSCFPLIRKEGVYLRFHKETNEKMLEGLYLFKRNGELQYIENKEFCGTIRDDKLIGMWNSESLNQKEKYLGYRDIPFKSNDGRILFYPPKIIDDILYNFQGWIYDDKILKGYYVSEDNEKLKEVQITF